MRWISLIALVLLATGLAACWFGGATPSAASPDAPLKWVRTASGWERPSDWSTPGGLYEPALHPLVLASGQLLVSVLALVAFQPARKSG
jgi:hypothetical protein